MSGWAFVHHRAVPEFIDPVFAKTSPKIGSINSGTGEKWPGPTIENPHYWDSDQEGRRRAITSPLSQEMEAKWHVGSLLIDFFK